MFCHDLPICCINTKTKLVTDTTEFVASTQIGRADKKKN